MSSCITMDSRCQLLNSMYDQYQKIQQDFQNAKIQLHNRYLLFLVSWFTNQVGSSQCEFICYSSARNHCRCRSVVSKDCRCQTYTGRNRNRFWNSSFSSSTLNIVSIHWLGLVDAKSWRNCSKVARPLWNPLTSNESTRLLHSRKCNAGFYKSGGFDGYHWNCFRWLQPSLCQYITIMDRIWNYPKFIHSRSLEFCFERFTIFVNVKKWRILLSRFINNSTILSFIPTIRDIFTSFFSAWKPKSFETMDVDTNKLFQQFGNITHAAMIVDAAYRVFSLLHTILKVISRGELYTIQVGNTGKQQSPSFWNTVVSLLLACLPTLFVTSCIVYMFIPINSIEYFRY